VLVYDGKARFERRVEAGCADEDVDGVFLSVVTQAAFLGYGADFAVYGFDIGLA